MTPTQRHAMHVAIGALATGDAQARNAAITQPCTLEEIRAQIASHDYSAELLLQHAMLLLDDAGQAKPVAVPAGYALVPVEPTAEMCAAPKAETWVGSNYCERIYRAMIAAAPPAPSAAEQAVIPPAFAHAASQQMAVTSEWCRGWDACRAHILSAAPAAEQAEPVDWRTPAVAWLRQRADRQRKTNADYPEHVKCYPSWEKRVRDLEWLADDLEREQAAPAEGGA